MTLNGAIELAPARISRLCGRVNFGDFRGNKSEETRATHQIDDFGRYAVLRRVIQLRVARPPRRVLVSDLIS
jgi:hypothetical protein